MSAILEVRDLHVHFPVTGGILRRPIGAVHAVNGITFSVQEGETLGVVGESGCGKTTLGRAIVRLHRPTAGTIRFKGVAIEGLSREELKPIRRDLQMIFQDPFGSLNPRLTVAATLAEPLQIHGTRAPLDQRDRIEEVIDLVGLQRDDLRKLPHEFSGGQRQRIGIARALVLEPSLVVADEPVSALDVSIQSQVLNLLVELQRRLGLAYIFISHDLTVVKYLADRIAVMYLGRIVELASSGDVYQHPRHPYTRALIAAVPSLRSKRRAEREPVVGGDVPSPHRPPPGCTFHTRCRHAVDRCRSEVPLLRSYDGDASHQVACHLAEEI
jgi:oligopeptide/dipeptide ABC transporter ATP-binding protein